MHELSDWMQNLERGGLPFDAVAAEVHRVGKHFLPTDLLARLAGARAELRLMTDFLDVALDKWDGVYDYESYIALSLLPLPGSGPGTDTDIDADLRRHDRLAVLLMGEVIDVELAAADGRSSRYPQQRPDAGTVAKRCRLGRRSVDAALERLGLAGRLSRTDPIAAARELREVVAGERTVAEARMLGLTYLPVSLVHDEHLFIRVLQSYENVFALLAVLLREAIGCVREGDAVSAARLLDLAASRMTGAGRLFSLLATMQVESFRTFRTWTDGASAIQSSNYKTVESLCRTPSPERVDSSAYGSVPTVRDQMARGQGTLDDAVDDASARGLLERDDRAKLEEAMRAFADSLLCWRRTHYSLATRMLGERKGTGYTEGTPYLQAARDIPVFESIEPGTDPEGGCTEGWPA